MKLHRIIDHTIRRQGAGLNLAGRVNAVVAANVEERSSKSRVSNRQRTRAVQNNDQQRREVS